MSFVFLALKCVSLLLLSILLLFAGLSALVLFMPVRYKARVAYEKKLTVDVEASWPLWIFHFIYSYTNGVGGFRLLIFNKRRFGSGGMADNKRKKHKKHTNKQRHNRRHFKSQKSRAGKRSNEKKAVKTGLFDKNSLKTEADSGVLRKIMQYPDKMLIFGETRRLAKGLLLAMKPDVLKLDAVIGFDDPCTTGRLLGALAFLAGINGLDICVRGSFDKPAFYGEAHFRGRIILWKFVWPIIRFICARPIWKIVKQLFFDKPIY